MSIKTNTFQMKAFLVAISLSIIVFNTAMSASANCINGQCEFIDSVHYKTATTFCLQTLTYQDVETDYTFFTILETGEKCQVYKSENEN